MRRLLVVGAGGHGAVVAETAQAMDRWATIEFLDDDGANGRKLGFPVAGTLEDQRRTGCIVEIQTRQIRRLKQQISVQDQTAGHGQKSPLVGPNALDRGSFR